MNVAAIIWMLSILSELWLQAIGFSSSLSQMTLWMFSAVTLTVQPWTLLVHSLRELGDKFGFSRKLPADTGIISASAFVSFLKDTSWLFPNIEIWKNPNQT